MRTRPLLLAFLLACLPTRLPLAEDEWSRVDGDPAGHIHALYMATANLILAAGNQGSLYRSTDGGGSWSLLPQATLRQVRGIGSANSMWLVAVGDSGTLLRSKDGGLTWQALTSATRRNLRAVGFAFATGYAIGDGGSVLKSEDGGAAWRQVAAPTTAPLSALHVLDARTVFVSGLDTLFVTRDGGASWSSHAIRHAVQEGPWFLIRQIHFQDERNGWLVAWRGIPMQDGKHTYVAPDYGLLATQDGGATWRRIEGMQPFAMHWPENGQGLIARQDGALFITRDGGLTWSANPEQPSLLTGLATAFSFSAERFGVIAGLQGRIHQTRDGGSTWRQSGIQLAPEHRLVAPVIRGMHFPTRERGYKVGGRNVYDLPGSIQATADGGLTWTELTSPDPFDLYAVHFLDSLRGVVAGGGLSNLHRPFAALHLTLDGGKTWRNQGEGMETIFRALSFPTASKGFVAGDRGRLLATEDGGGNWTDLPSTGADIHALQFLDGQTGFAGGLRTLPPAAPGLDSTNIGVLLATLDGGKTWRTLAVDSAAAPIFSLQFVTERFGFYLSQGGYLMRTLDGGVTWTPLGAKGRFQAFRFSSPDTGYAVGEIIWRTHDGGTTWVPRHEPGLVPFQSHAVMVLPDARSAYVAYGFGPEYRMLNPVPAPVSLLRAPGAAPAPFPLLELMPGGRIAFALAGRTRVTALIVDAQGRFRARLAEEMLPSGRHDLLLPASPCGNSPCFLDFRADSFRRALPLGRAAR